SGPTIEQVQAALTAVSAFLAQLQAAVQQETKEWVTEFQTALAELDKKITDQLPETPKLGALNVEVLNGDLCDDGWTVSLDGGDQERKYGKTAAFHGLVAGLHVVAAEGQISKTS